MKEIFKRGDCRHFKELTPVAEEDLLTLIKAGMQGRSCGNQDSREFILVTREDLVKAISHNSIIAGPARKAAAVIVIIGNRENILTEAAHLALGTLWMQIYPYSDRKAHISHILDIPANKEPFCAIAIGYAEKPPLHINRYMPRLIHKDLYGSKK